MNMCLICCLSAPWLNRDFLKLSMRKSFISVLFPSKRLWNFRTFKNIEFYFKNAGYSHCQSQCSMPHRTTGTNTIHVHCCKQDAMEQHSSSHDCHILSLLCLHIINSLWNAPQHYNKSIQNNLPTTVSALEITHHSQENGLGWQYPSHSVPEPTSFISISIVTSQLTIMSLLKTSIVEIETIISRYFSN